MAHEIKVNKRDNLFAATPPLEVKKMLLPLAVTEGIGYKKDRREHCMKLDFIDVRSEGHTSMLKPAGKFVSNCLPKITKRACAESCKRLCTAQEKQL